MGKSINASGFNGDSYLYRDNQKLPEEKTKSPISFSRPFKLAALAFLKLLNIVFSGCLWDKGEGIRDADTDFVAFSVRIVLIAAPGLLWTVARADSIFLWGAVAQSLVPVVGYFLLHLFGLRDLTNREYWQNKLDG